MPRPGILKKIAALDPRAPEAIIDRAVKIGDERQEAERAALAARRFGLKEIWDGVAALFAPRRAARRAGPEASVLALNWAWAATGDNLRAAIAEYMQDNGLDADGLGLDESERSSLVPLNAPRPGFR